MALRIKDSVDLKELEKYGFELNENITWWQNRFHAVERNNRELKERIDKAKEYINKNWGHWCSNHCKYATETIEILGDKENGR